MVDFVTAFSTASQALKLINDLRGIDKAFDAAELKLKIADLNIAVADLKTALVEAKEEIASKEAEIARLNDLLERTANLVEYQGYRYDKNEKGQPTGWAYCPVCEAAGHLIHITKVLHAQKCPKCNGFYTTHVFGY
jgi:hypothetical protein